MHFCLLFSPRSFPHPARAQTDAGVRTNLPDILLMRFSIASQSIVWNLSGRQSDLSQENVVCSHNLFVILSFVAGREQFHLRGFFYVTSKCQSSFSD